jgi:AcrR family transcriptional regulator
MSDQMEERARRIVETAVELAEEGGFEAVRLRDVAAHAGVALGTLYRRFRSKEDLLVAALASETRALEHRFAKSPPRGDDELERVMGFFALVGRGLLRRKNLAKALLKAAASGEPGLAQKMASYHAHIEAMIVMSMRDEVVRNDGELGDPKPNERERLVAQTLSQVWFALLLGWSGGVHDQAQVDAMMRSCADLVLRGAREMR